MPVVALVSGGMGVFMHVYVKLTLVIQISMWVDGLWVGGRGGLVEFKISYSLYRYSFHFEEVDESYVRCVCVRISHYVYRVCVCLWVDGWLVYV